MRKFQRYETSLPESFLKGGNVYQFNRKNPYTRSKFRTWELNEDGHFANLVSFEVRNPSFGEKKQTNPRELVEGLFFLTLIIFGILGSGIWIYNLTGDVRTVPFGVFGGVFVTIIILGILSEFTKESEFIIISKDQSVILQEMGEHRFRYYVVDRNNTILYSIHLKKGLGKITLNAHEVPDDISDMIVIKKTNHEMAHVQPILVRKQHFLTIQLFIDGEEYLELAYGAGAANNDVYVSIPGKVQNPAIMAIAIAFIHRVWTIPTPEGSGGG